MKLAWMIFVLIYGALGFNLEWRIPVIKRGKSESYFGYSVAEHQEILENDNKSISW